MDTSVEALTLGLILYVILPLWVSAGSFDYFCHKRTKIEENAGIVESLVHAIMGFLVGLPLWLAIFHEINVLLLLVCFVCFVLHELVAHFDVRWADDKREIGVWEQHAHSYLLTIPFYMMTLFICRNWEVFVRTITFQWRGDLTLVARPEPVGSMRYVLWYATFMFVVAVIPYTEEVIRCWRYRRKHQTAA